VEPPRVVAKLEPMVLDPREGPRLAFKIGRSAARDMDLLAEWLPTLLLRAFEYSDRVRRPPARDRADFIDHHHHGLEYARQIAARLEWLGDVHRPAATVLYAGFCHVQLPDKDIVEMFADRVSRRGWMVGKPGIRKAAHEQAPGIVKAAREAYQSLDGDPPAIRRTSLRQLETMASNAWDALVADRRDGKLISSHVASLRQIAAIAAKAGDHKRAAMLRANAQTIIDEFVNPEAVALRRRQQTAGQSRIMHNSHNSPMDGPAGTSKTR
jgi:hypothetical protein